MSEKTDKTYSRRDVVAGFLRYLSLGGLGAGGAAGIAKSRRFSREGKCVGSSVCTQCGVFGRCGLPRAMSVRAGLGEGNDG